MLASFIASLCNENAFARLFENSGYAIQLFHHDIVIQAASRRVFLESEHVLEKRHLLSKHRLPHCEKKSQYCAQLPA